MEIELKKELLFTTNTSFARLLQLGSDAMTLYMFYLYTSNHQDNQSVYATTSYCQKGLGWSKERVTKNKKILEDDNWIETVIRRNAKGVIQKHYVKVKFRVANAHILETHPLDIPPVANHTTNTPIENKIHQEKEISSFNKEEELNSPINNIQPIQVKQFIFEEELDKLLVDNPNTSPETTKMCRIVHWYIKIKHIDCRTKEEWVAMRGRLFKSAKLLLGYSRDDLEYVVQYLENKNLSWTLETIVKLASEIINNNK